MKDNIELKDHVKRVKSLRAKYAMASKRAKEIKEELEEAEQSMLGEMNQQKLDSVKGQGVLFYVVTRDALNLDDWTQLSKFIIRNKALDLLQRRVSVTAVKERIGAGKKVPGVSIQKVRGLNMKTL